MRNTSVRVQCLDQGLEPLHNWAQREKKTIQREWSHNWAVTMEDIDRKFEPVKLYKLCMVVEQWSWEHNPGELQIRTHTQHIHRRGETIALTTGQATTPTTTIDYTSTPTSTGNRVGQSLDPDNTLGELWHSLQWQQVQEQQLQQQQPPQTHKKTRQASTGTSWSHHSTMVTMEHVKNRNTSSPRTWDLWTMHTQGYY